MQVRTDVLIAFLKQQRNAAMDDAALLNARIVTLEEEVGQLRKLVPPPALVPEQERTEEKQAPVMGE